MYKRRTVTLLLVFLLVLSHAALVYAAADKADAAYLRELKKVEDYLRKNYGEPYLGERARDYIRKSLKGMDVKRLEGNLRSFLRCAPGVSLPNMLDAYAGEIRGDYASIYERARDYKLSPEAAADENSYNRAMLGARIGARTGGESPPELEFRARYCGSVVRDDGQVICETCIEY